MPKVHRCTAGEVVIDGFDYLAALACWLPFAIAAIRAHDRRDHDPGDEDRS